MILLKDLLMVYDKNRSYGRKCRLCCLYEVKMIKCNCCDLALKLNGISLVNSPKSEATRYAWVWTMRIGRARILPPSLLPVEQDWWGGHLRRAHFDCLRTSLVVAFPEPPSVFFQIRRAPQRPTLSNSGFTVSLLPRHPSPLALYLVGVGGFWRVRTVSWRARR